jgi:ATP-dependent DNA helicase RecQ
MRDVLDGKYKLVYAAPERLRQRPFLHAMRKIGISLFVVDEAHCVSMWGHDFRPDYLFIGRALEYLGHPTVLAMTATATPQMRTEIANHFNQQLQVVSTGTHRPNLILESVMVRTDEDKMRELLKLCRENDGSGIVYVRSRKKTEELARLLRRERIKATHYHAGMESEERARTQEEFMDDRWRVICATVAFGMGIDKPDVRFVIHYSLPQSLEDYYQEAGRAGRDDLPSRCVLLCTPSDKALTTRWMREERVGIELPRDCYQMIRELTTSRPFTVIHCDDFERDLQQDETKIRVAISMLENAGLIKRHMDIPTTSTIKLRDSFASDGANGFTEFVANARLRPGQQMPFNTMELCERSGVNPQDIEEKLLSWRDDGYIYYHGSGRVMLLERLPASKDARKLLEDLIERHARIQEARIDKAVHYAESRYCKHGIIAHHFSDPAIENCVSCDNCAPQKQPGEQISKQAKPASPNLSDTEKMKCIIETVRMIPGKVGFTGLVKALKGSIASYIKLDQCPNFGILANEPKTTIERRVTELLESGQLVRDDSEYRLIWLAPGS